MVEEKTKCLAYDNITKVNIEGIGVQKSEDNQKLELALSAMTHIT